MEEKYNLNSISKAFEKLFNAGFNTSKKIATLDIKEVRKIPNLTMSDFYIISDLWELVKKNNNKTAQLFIEFLSGYKEKGNDVDINGTITFEVEAKNKKEAQAKVDDILSNTSVKEAIKSYRNNIVLNEKVKQDKDRER